MKKKILLLNPPSKRLCIRDYYCSKISQANYISHPIDFVILSAILKNVKHEIFLVDSVVGKYSMPKTIAILENIKPDIIITLSGAVSWEEDKTFLEQIKNMIKTKMLVTGDIFLENPKFFINNFKFIDGIITDFTSMDVAKYIDGDSVKQIFMSEFSNKFNLPVVPAHEIFLKYKYRYPFTLTSKYCSVLTEFGCPFKCSFCIMGKLKYKYRDAENVISELEYIKSLGIKEIFFVDQTFGANKKNTLKLLSEMINKNLNLNWFCFSRVDVLDEQLINMMKKSGCHTIIIGIESGSEMLLNKYRKGYNTTQIIETLNICKKNKIRTVGTFIIGLPDENLQSSKETLDLVKNLPLDYASFNVAVPRFGTDLRKEAIENNLARNDNFTMDQSGSEIAMSTRYLSQQEVRKIRQMMVKNFYLRPGYIIKRFLNLKTFYELYQNILNAYYLIKHTWSKKG
ncbi:MAG: radical SAM protein [Endomicrobiia bacterium]